MNATERVDPASLMRQAAIKLRNGSYGCRSGVLSQQMARVLSELLDDQARRFKGETVEDFPECPSCDSVPHAPHAPEIFHDEACGEVWAETPFNDADTGRCRCFDPFVAVARLVHGQEPRRRQVALENLGG